MESRRGDAARAGVPCGVEERDEIRDPFAGVPSNTGNDSAHL
jgi:hypothetical protein